MAWSVVLEARDAADRARRKIAVGQLLALYWEPVYRLLRRRGFDAEAAKDLTQGFFTSFLERNFLRYVDPPRGEFSAFLRTTLEHPLILAALSAAGIDEPRVCRLSLGGGYVVWGRRA